MKEQNILNATFTAIMAGFTDFFTPLKWFVLLAIIIVLADLRLA